MASLLDLADARLRGLLDSRKVERPSMTGLLGNAQPQGTLAGTIQGFTPTPMQAMSNQAVMDYARNVASTARQNMAQQMSDLDKALVMDQGGINVGDRQAFARLLEQIPGLMGATAYHGTPHTIRGKFDISKVGTGEGAQAYGHGMYFAESPSVAETYKTKLSGGLGSQSNELLINGQPLQNLSEAQRRAYEIVARDGRKNALGTAKDLEAEGFDASHIREALAATKGKEISLVKNEGNLYKVDIPDEYIPTMMDYDKPLGQQSAIVKKALNEIKKQITPEMKMELGGDLNLLFGKDVTPVQFLNTMEIIHPTGGVGIGERMLNDLGVKGIRYKDAMSRGADEGTSNFVVFDPSAVKILERNNKKLESLLD